MFSPSRRTASSWSRSSAAAIARLIAREGTMGGMFNCGQCGGDHHTDDVGDHHAVRVDGRAFEFCEPCYMAALAAHLNGDRPLSEFDGKDFATHFVCPD